MLRPPFHSSSSAPLFTAAEETQDPPIVQTHPGLDYDLHVNRTRQLVPSPGRIILSCRRSFVHVENRGGAALRLGDAVRGVAFRTLGPARHRPLSNHLSTRYDNKVVRVRVCGSGGGSGSGCGCVYVCMMARGVWWTVGAPASTERNKRDYPPSARLLFMHLYLVLRSSLSILPFDVKRVPPPAGRFTGDERT